VTAIFITVEAGIIYGLVVFGAENRALLGKIASRHAA